jgi:hypothetical protein
LASIYRIAQRTSDSRRRDVFEREMGIRPSTWLGVDWARWGGALKEAGFQPNEFNAKVDEAELLHCFVIAARHFGRPPTNAEL